MSNWLRPLLVLKCDLFKMYPERPLARTAIQPTFFQRRWDFYGDEVSDFSYLLGSFQWGASWGIQTFSGTTPGRSNLSVLILVSSSLGIRNSEIHKLSISSTSHTYLEPSVRLNAAPCRQLLTSVPMGERRCGFGPQTLPWRPSSYSVGKWSIQTKITPIGSILIWLGDLHVPLRTSTHTLNPEKKDRCSSSHW